MKRKTLAVLSVILIFAFCLAVLFNDSVRIGPSWTKKPKIAQVQLKLELKQKHSHDIEVQVAKPQPSRFLYLLQTESCLPDHLGSVKAIGNASACQCDVLVLSYKQICSVTPSPHAEYLFNSSTTWTTGRNLLFEVARRRGEKYLYYIFMDDDIVLRFKTEPNNHNPWREFENFLKRIEPAVGAVDIYKNEFIQIAYRARKKQGCSVKEKTDYLPTVRFDAAYDAFHYQAIEYLLPYSSSYDATNWWLSQLHTEIKCEIIFQGHTVLHTELRAVNPKHRSYPRKMANDSDVLALLKEMEAELPEEYRNSNVLLEWKKDGLNHGGISSTYCLPPPPPHMPITPYTHTSR